MNTGKVIVVGGVLLLIGVGTWYFLRKKKTPTPASSSVPGNIPATDVAPVEKPVSNPPSGDVPETIQTFEEKIIEQNAGSTYQTSSKEVFPGIGVQLPMILSDDEISNLKGFCSLPTSTWTNPMGMPNYNMSTKQGLVNVLIQRSGYKGDKQYYMDLIKTYFKC